MKNYFSTLLAFKQIISLATLAHISVHMFIGRRQWLSKCTHSAWQWLSKCMHSAWGEQNWRTGALLCNKSVSNIPSCLLSLKWKMELFLCSVHQVYLIFHLRYVSSFEVSGWTRQKTQIQVSRSLCPTITKYWSSNNLTIRCPSQKQLFCASLHLLVS